MKFLITLLATLFITPRTEAQVPFANVALPELPAVVEFCGERLPLENFDTRESLQREMLVTYYMHSRTWLTLLNTRRYFAIIEPILEKNGIPLDFKYLCMAESGLNPNAVSSAKAGGLWQIMPATGKQFGLEVGSEIDERFHIEKSTEVACRHLQESYDRFGSWTLAAAAYNLGNAGVARRIDRQGTRNYYDAFFPQETMRYLFRVVSFKLLTEDPARYGYNIKGSDYYKPLDQYREIAVSDKHIEWPKFASGYGTTYKMLRELNPWIREYEFKNPSGKTYKVKIPTEGFRDPQ